MKQRRSPQQVLVKMDGTGKGYDFIQVSDSSFEILKYRIVLTVIINTGTNAD